jgi:hypothetical protein
MKKIRLSKKKKKKKKKENQEDVVNPNELEKQELKKKRELLYQNQQQQSQPQQSKQFFFHLQEEQQQKRQGAYYHNIDLIIDNEKQKLNDLVLIHLNNFFNLNASEEDYQDILNFIIEKNISIQTKILEEIRMKRQEMNQKFIRAEVVGDGAGKKQDEREGGDEKKNQSNFIIPNERNIEIEEEEQEQDRKRKVRDGKKRDREDNDDDVETRTSKKLKSKETDPKQFEENK